MGAAHPPDQRPDYPFGSTQSRLGLRQRGPGGSTHALECAGPVNVAVTMSELDFPGRLELVRCIDEAVGRDCIHEITDELRQSLCRMISSSQVQLPACCYEETTGHYARRELYHSAEHGYSVIAMTWGPGQGTPIHDHSGMWCVEGVWHGALEITQYELLESDGDRFRFRAVGTMQAGTGSAGSLVPPHEYHTIRNPSRDSVAVSLHVYRGEMRCCSVFSPADACWHVRDIRQLSLDATQ
jgi:3-mercaptopropionate dioxygenase